MRKLVALFAVGGVVGALLGAGLRPPRVVYQTRTETRPVVPRACSKVIEAARRFAEEAQRVVEAKDSRFYGGIGALLLDAFRTGEQHDSAEFSDGILRTVSDNEQLEKITTSNWALDNVGSEADAWANHGPLDTANYAKDCESAGPAG